MLKLEDLKRGHSMPGDNLSDPAFPPPWLDKEKFNRGRKFFIEHFTSVLLAMYTSLACGLSVRNLLDPLIFTERSNTPRKAFKRYLSTFKHVVHWHLGDVWNMGDSAFASVQSVRQMHGDVARAMQASGKMSVSQYDMALVQCGFMGAIVTYPADYGVRCTEEELECYIHFWRGIGHLLGMDDSYNICRGNYDETLKICSEIEAEIVGEALRNPPEGFKHMARAFIDGSNVPLPLRLFTYDSVLTWVISIAHTFRQNSSSYKSTCEPRFCDYVRVKVYQVFCCMLRNFPSVEKRINSWFIGNWCNYLKMEIPHI